VLYRCYRGTSIAFQPDINLLEKRRFIELLLQIAPFTNLLISPKKLTLGYYST